MTDWHSKDELKEIFAHEVAGHKETLHDYSADEAVISLMLMVREMKEIGLPVGLENLPVAPSCLFHAVPGTKSVAFGGILHLGNNQVFVGVTLQDNDTTLLMQASDWRHNPAENNSFLKFSYLRQPDCMAGLQEVIVAALARDAAIKELDSQHVLKQPPKRIQTLGAIIP